MGTRDKTSKVKFTVGNFAAMHTRLVLFVLLLLLFVSMQGSVAAESIDLGGVLVGTNGEGAADSGP